MEGGEDMVEEVFDVCAKVLEIPLRGTRQVGSVHGLPTVSDTFLNKPGREHQRRTFNQIVGGTYVPSHTVHSGGLRLPGPHAERKRP